MTRLLLILLLVGSPREIANRIVKHHTDTPPLPLVMPFKSSSVAVPQTNRTIILKIIFNNPNAPVERYVLEKSNDLNGPWIQFASGVVNPYSWVTNTDSPTNGKAFYRAGFVWP